MWNSKPPSLPTPPPASPEPNNTNNNRTTTVTPTRGNVSAMAATLSGSVKKNRVAFQNDVGGSPSNNKSHTKSPNKQQQAELEALRQRGLAKLLNKHFSQETQRLAAEKAAVDAALLDLEQRKQRAAANHNNNNNGNGMATPPAKHGNSQVTSSPYTATPMDELYHRIHRMKAECKQKEKETLLLYQRYVHKFGFTGQIKAPTTSEMAATETNNNNKTKALEPSPSLDTPEPVPPPTTPEGTNSNKKNLDSSNDRTTTSPTAHLATPPAAKSTPVRESIVQSSVEKIQQTISNNAMETTPTPTTAAKSNTSSITTSEQQPPPATVTPIKKASPRNSPTQEIVLRSFVQGEDGGNKNGEDGLLARYLRNQQEQQNKAREEDDDISSLISGLTSVDSATTRQILLDCELTVATFLDEERKAIQALLLQEGGEVNEDGNNKDNANAATTAASGDRNMDSLSLPNLSAAKKNKKAVSSSSKSVTSVISSPTQVQTLQANAALEAETMAQQMQQILRAFEQDQTTSDDKSTTSGSRSISSLDMSSNNNNTDKGQTPQKGSPFPTNNPGEDWTVLFDHQHQRRYYYESNSGTTQWHMPSTDEPNITNEREVVLDPEEVMPESVSVTSNTSERIRKYRAKRRRRRRKRLLRVAAAVALVAGSGAYYYYNHYQPAQGGNNNTVGNSGNATAASSFSENPSSTAATRPSAATAEIRQAASPSPPPTPSRGGEGAADTTTTAPQTARKVGHDLGHLHQTMASASSEKRRLQQEKQQQQQKRQAETEVDAGNESTNEESEEESSKSNDGSSKVRAPPRPWGCNVPFAYVTSKHCRKLASDQPLLNENEFFMLQ